MENIKPKESKKSQTKSKSTSALPKNQPGSKKENYRFISKTSLLQDFRNTASSGIAGMKQKLSSFTNILRPARARVSDSNYGALNEQPTPVKLYSPFTFESPMPSKFTHTEEERKRLRVQLFNTPTQKTKEDIESLGNGMNDLWHLSFRIEQTYGNSTTSSHLSDERSTSTKVFEQAENLFEDDASLL